MNNTDPVRIFLHNKNLMATHGEVEQIDLPLVIHDHKVTIVLSVGKLRMGETKLQRTFVVRSDYREVVDAHRALLPMRGYGTHIYHDYAVEVRAATRKICAEREWIINNEFGHCPVLHFVVSKEPTHYQDMTDEAVKDMARYVIKSSVSKEEVERRMREEMPGYSGGMAFTFTPRLGYINGRDRFSHGMFMAMIHGPRGNTINL
jgi:hypothetical protein